MTRLRQDRVPDQTLSNGPAPEDRATADVRAATRGIVLALRLWGPDSAGRPEPLSWQSSSPAVCLALDLITASGGSPEPAPGPILSAGFSNAQSALLTVRRLQSAFQGLAEGGSSRNVTAAMLIRSAEDQAPGSVQAALENPAPGQILLTSAIAESVSQLPNVTLRNAAQGGWSEMLWRSSEKDASTAADEQSVLHLIRELGREDPVPPQPPAPVFEPAPAAPAPPVESAAATGSFTARRAHLEEEPEPAGRNKKWFIIGGAAAALVIAGILVVAGVSGNHAKTPTPTPPPPAPQSPSAGSGETSPQPALPTPSVDTGKAVSTPKPPPPKPAPAPGNAPSLKPKSDAYLGARPQPAGHCDFTDAEIPSTLDRADSNLHAGKLSAAEASYESLLNCPAARQRATVGLQRVKQRRAMDGSDQ